LSAGISAAGVIVLLTRATTGAAGRCGSAGIGDFGRQFALGILSRFGDAAIFRISLPPAVTFVVLSWVTVGRSAGAIGTAVFIVFKTIGHGSAPPTAVEDAKVTGRLLIRSQRFAASPSLAPPAPTDCNMAACRIGRSQYGRTVEPRPRRPMISLDPARAAVVTGSDVSCWRAGEPATVSGLPGGHCCPV
jgi:hypothetical protein